MKHIIYIVLSFVVYQSYGQSTLRISQNNVTFRKCSSLKCASIGTLNESDGGKIIQKENEETIDGYGTHPWYRVVIGQDTGSVFGALVDVLPDKSKEIQLNINGNVHGTEVNIRECGSINCDIVTTLFKGDKVKVISKTPYRDEINSAWTNWYFIEFEDVKGYIYGSLLTVDDSTVLQFTQKGKIYNAPNGQVTHSIKAGKILDILQKGKSENIRPFGRHYWYQVALAEGKKGWVFGGITTKASTPVDCQCVDFVKHQLQITGATKNAFEWDEILTGMIPITQHNNSNQILNYTEIKDSSFQFGDIVVFDNQHSEVHHLYGHIGFFKDKRIIDGKLEILIEGGNHPNKQHEYFTKSRCNNVSEKWYLLDENVRVFRE
ncbi:MAG: SH3 domain-containing protein [Saprospiraceae bacterium]